ncbi:zinc finger domain-containing protein [Micromonospora chersina]|uniref:zinc finger domain-containing protein n=1 Tax=Micromonospora chersina TaxID=47854 RepID=UPI0033D279F1
MEHPVESPEGREVRELKALSREQAALWFWSALQYITDAAAAHRDEELYQAARKTGMAVLSQGIPLPFSEEYVVCPVCHSYPGQNCINMPRHTLNDNLHPERVERARKLRELTENGATEA